MKRIVDNSDFKPSQFYRQLPSDSDFDINSIYFRLKSIVFDLFLIEKSKMLIYNEKVDLYQKSRFISTILINFDIKSIYFDINQLF